MPFSMATKTGAMNRFFWCAKRITSSAAAGVATRTRPIAAPSVVLFMCFILVPPLFLEWIIAKPSEIRGEPAAKVKRRRDPHPPPPPIDRRGAPLLGGDIRLFAPFPAD